MFIVQRFEDGFRFGIATRHATRHAAEAWVARQTDKGRVTTLSGSQGRTVYYTIEEEA